MVIKRLGMAILFILATSYGRRQALAARTPASLGSRKQRWPSRRESTASRFVRGGPISWCPARVNGRQATLLLDTGAALSTFSVKILPTIDTDHESP